MSRKKQWLISAMLIWTMMSCVGIVSGQAADAGTDSLLAAYRGEVRVLRLAAADMTYRVSIAEVAVDSMEIVHRWEIQALERALEASERHWWNDERLWFAAGALSVALMVELTVEVSR